MYIIYTFFATWYDESLWIFSKYIDEITLSYVFGLVPKHRLNSFCPPG